MAIKVAMIGAGSVGFTRGLMKDILTVPELADTEFAFTDLSKTNLEMVARLCKRDIKENKLPATVRTSTNRLAMLEGADYVICMIRQGGLEAFQTDIDIPLKYGVDQCVGDTLCAGGIMYAQRTIPVLLEFCKEIRATAKPGAMFLNYSNPMAMNTWACNQYGGVKTIGLCHGVQGAHWQITACVEIWAKSTRAAPGRRRTCTGGTCMSSPPASTTRPGLSRSSGAGSTMLPLSAGAVRGSPRIFTDRKSAHRRAAPYRLLQHGIQRAPQRVPALVPQAHGRNSRVDRPVLLDQRRDRRLPAGVHRGSQLV